MTPEKDDRIYLSTRLVAGAVVPVLVLAWIILFFYPGLSGERFAWQIEPPMTAVYMGAGYLGGAWLFARAAFGRRWHTVAAGFLPVTAFTGTMLLDTILHWQRFDLSHPPFLIWLVLYIVTPFLVPALWLRNRRADPQAPQAAEAIVPAAPAWAMRLLGGFILVFAAVGFISPDWLAGVWAWPLSPLTARVLSGWLALLGVGGLVVAGERRWSGWKTGIQSIGLWHALVLVGAVIHAADFKSGPANWYTASVAAMLAGMALLYFLMEMRGRPGKTRPQFPNSQVAR